jgi:hypothetical protein
VERHSLSATKKNKELTTSAFFVYNYGEGKLLKRSFLRISSIVVQLKIELKIELKM